jgi:hypothetical protein
MITVHILETSARNKILVSWRESGLCNYTEQTWHLHRAKKTGYCALSGQPVQRGDEVYQPIGKPVNHDTYILADIVKSADMPAS